MKMQTETVELRILKPEKKDNWLTNGESYSQIVYLGKEDDANNWKEITQKEYELLNPPDVLA